ncbi:MAG: VanZ family protein [Pseudomonadota bacterium]
MHAPGLDRPGLWRAVGWCLIVAVVYLSLTPHPPPSAMSYGDKLNHFAGYAALMAWWLQLERQVWRLALLLIVLSLILEILQDLSGYRQGDIYDMAANTCGVALGWLATRLLPDWLPRIERLLPR